MTQISWGTVHPVPIPCSLALALHFCPILMIDMIYCNCKWNFSRSSSKTAPNAPNVISKGSNVPYPPLCMCEWNFCCISKIYRKCKCKWYLTRTSSITAPNNPNKTQISSGKAHLMTILCLLCMCLQMEFFSVSSWYPEKACHCRLVNLNQIGRALIFSDKKFLLHIDEITIKLVTKLSL